jgi:hypothetical protein
MLMVPRSFLPLQLPHSKCLRPPHVPNLLQGGRNVQPKHRCACVCTCRPARATSDLPCYRAGPACCVPLASRCCAPRMQRAACLPYVMQLMSRALSATAANCGCTRGGSSTMADLPHTTGLPALPRDDRNSNGTCTHPRTSHTRRHVLCRRVGLDRRHLLQSVQRVRHLLLRGGPAVCQRSVSARSSHWDRGKVRVRPNCVRRFAVSCVGLARSAAVEAPDF